MTIENKKIGFCLTGSFCTFRKSIEQLKKIVNLNADVYPIMSFNSYNCDTKFGKSKDFIDLIKLEHITDLLRLLSDNKDIHLC